MYHHNPDKIVFLFRFDPFLAINGGGGGQRDIKLRPCLWHLFVHETGFFFVGGLP